MKTVGNHKAAAYFILYHRFVLLLLFREISWWVWGCGPGSGTDIKKESLVDDMLGDIFIFFLSKTNQKKYDIFNLKVS